MMTHSETITAWITKGVTLLTAPENRNSKVRSDNLNRIIDLVNLQAVMCFNDDNTAHLKKAYNFLFKLYQKNNNNSDLEKMLLELDEKLKEKGE